MLILDNVPSDAGFISLVFDKFSDEAINIDMISQTPPRGKYTSIAFTFDDSELTKALGCLSHIKEECPSLSSSVSSSNSKITVMSEDMRSGYGFASNKGYGSAEHIEALRRLGPTPIHRNSFISNFV